MTVQLRAVCEFRPRKSSWQDEEPDYPGRVSPWDVGADWVVAPYPPGFEHGTGRHGDLWTCPACNRAIWVGARPSPRGAEWTERRVRRLARGSSSRPPR